MNERLCLASNNEHKIKELRSLLPSTLEVVSLKDIGCFQELEETGNTFKDNAYQKAWYVAKQYKINSLADDSGLVVPYLEGAPGVYSARYAGPEKNDKANVKKLLESMKNVENREAYFICVICLIRNEAAYFFEGRVNGTIGQVPVGEDGFGYDPIFIPDGFSLTFAQMDAHMKNAMSHRAIAMQQLVDFYFSN